MSVKTLADMSFSRASAAWYPLSDQDYGMREYVDDEPRWIPAVSREADPDLTIHYVTDGTYPICPRCLHNGILYGTPYNAGEPQAQLYKSTDGGETWSEADDGSLDFGSINSMKAAGKLLASVGTAVYWGAVDGNGDVTWTRCEDGLSGDFSLDTGANMVFDWGFLETAAGSIIIGEYGDPTSGPHIYRSTDDGANFAEVLEISGARHIHVIRQHKATGRLIASVGDTGDDATQLIYSDDDGATWGDYTTAMQGSLQPTAILDYDHDERMLFGSDTKWNGVYDGDVSHATPPLANAELDFQSCLMFRDNSNASAGSASCWGLQRFAGDIYATSRDEDASITDPCQIAVSPDGVHWGIYIEITALTGQGYPTSVSQILGIANGRVHALCVWKNAGGTAIAATRHISFKPAKAVMTHGLLIEPTGTNKVSDTSNDVADGEVATSGDTKSYIGTGSWTNAPTDSVDATKGYVLGSGCLKRDWQPNDPADLARQAHCEIIKMTGTPNLLAMSAMICGYAFGFYTYLSRYSGGTDSTAHKPRYWDTLSGRWKLVRWGFPYAGDGTAGVRFVARSIAAGSFVDLGGTEFMTLWYAALMITESQILTSFCHDTRAADKLSVAYDGGARIRHAATVVMTHDSRLGIDPWSSVQEQYVLFSLRVDEDNHIQIGYDCSDQTFYMAVTTDSGTETVKTSATYFLEGEQVAFTLDVKANASSMTVSKASDDSFSETITSQYGGDLLNLAGTLYSARAGIVANQGAGLPFVLLSSELDEDYEESSSGGNAFSKSISV